MSDRTFRTNLFRWMSARPGRHRVEAFLCLILLFAIAGCASGGPTRTAGTGNVPPEQLAIVHIQPHTILPAWKGQAIHAESFYIGEAQYAVTADKSFYVPPGAQTFSIEYGPCQHGWAKVEAPFNAETGIFEGPFGRWEATLEAGKEYVVTATTKQAGRFAVQTEHAFREVDAAAKAK